MKAAILEELDRIVIRDRDKPACGDAEAVLRVEACAVCGSDLRIFHFGKLIISQSWIQKEALFIIPYKDRDSLF